MNLGRWLTYCYSTSCFMVVLVLDLSDGHQYLLGTPLDYLNIDLTSLTVWLSLQHRSSTVFSYLQSFATERFSFFDLIVQTVHDIDHLSQVVDQKCGPVQSVGEDFNWNLK